MYNVVKRDGRSVDFNITRISNAITNLCGEQILFSSGPARFAVQCH